MLTISKYWNLLFKNLCFKAIEIPQKIQEHWNKKASLSHYHFPKYLDYPKKKKKKKSQKLNWDHIKGHQAQNPVSKSNQVGILILRR